LINLMLFIARRARFHWIGSSRRERRFKRPCVALLFLNAVLWLEPHEFILWSALSGSGIAIFLNLYLVYRFFPRKRAHWV
jgi:hypothetical protein